MKAKLERIDRRVCLSLQKKPSEAITTPLQVDISDETTNTRPSKIHSPLNKQKLSPHRQKLDSPPIKATRNENRAVDAPSPVSTVSPPTVRVAQRSQEQKKSPSPKCVSPRTTVPKSPPGDRRITREIAAKETVVLEPGLEKFSNVPSTPDNNKNPVKNGTPHLRTESEDFSRKLRTPASKRKCEAESDPTPKRAKGGGGTTLQIKLDKCNSESDGHTDHSLRSRDKLKIQEGAKNGIKENLIDTTTVPVVSIAAIKITPSTPTIDSSNIQINLSKSTPTNLDSKRKRRLSSKGKLYFEASKSE